MPNAEGSWPVGVPPSAVAVALTHANARVVGVSKAWNCCGNQNNIGELQTNLPYRQEVLP
jgi:hypothetical protein